MLRRIMGSCGVRNITTGSAKAKVLYYQTASKRVNIAESLPKDVFEYLDGIKTTVDHYAKAKKLNVTFNPISKNSNKFSIKINKRVVEFVPDIQTPISLNPLPFLDFGGPNLFVSIPTNKRVLSKVINFNTSNTEDSPMLTIYKALEQAANK